MNPAAFAQGLLTPGAHNQARERPDVRHVAIDAQINSDATELLFALSGRTDGAMKMFACASCVLAARSCHSMASDSGWIKACAPARCNWNNRLAPPIEHEALSVKRLEPGHVFEVERVR